jgi:hypothetical protein
MKKDKINYGFRRTDVLFFGVIIGMMLTIVLVLLFGLNWFDISAFGGTWITLSWISLLSVVILPVRLFPNTKWAKWWDGNVF